MWRCSSAPFTTWGMGQGMGWHGGIGLLSGLLLVVLLAWLAARGFGPRRTGGHVADRRDSLEILKSRLARGEITLAEFDTLKKVL